MSALYKAKYDAAEQQIAQLQSELGEAKKECERLKGAIRLYECRCAFGMGTLTTWTHTAECVAMKSAMKD